MSTDIALDFFNRLNNSSSDRIDITKLSSAHRARFISWCISKGIQYEKFSDEHKTAQRPAFIHQEERNSSSLSIGIDIQSVAELFPEKIQDLKSAPELLKIFSQREIAYSETKPNPLATLTGIFSAKEAIVKAGCAQAEKNQLADIEILYEIDGRPTYQGVDLSISHSSEFAVAVAISKVEDSQKVARKSTECESPKLAIQDDYKDKKNVLVIAVILTLFLNFSFMLLEYALH